MATTISTKPVITSTTDVASISKAVFATLGATDVAKFTTSQTSDINADQISTVSAATLAAMRQLSLNSDIAKAA